MKKILTALLLMLAVGLGGVFLLFQRTAPKPDIISLNEAMMNAIQGSDQAETLRLLNDALRQEAERIESARKQRDRELKFFLGLYIGVFSLAGGLLCLYWDKTILRPFKKLEAFAGRVANGDLSIPLEMDRKNRFGAFSESFDLMREQLGAARESERQANIGKKELVASLSHDIKTPVASIKVIAELLQAKQPAAAGNQGDGVFDAMSSIIRKADQIDLLISNMFTATLEELKQLRVSPAEITTRELEEIIRTSDYQKRIRPFTLPECVVTADSLRFRQVIDNIIGNSYKYADTEIEVSGEFDRDCFVLTVRDFGPGVSPEELSLLCEKFYRAKNAEGKSGSGLGLYLSKYFVTEMSGKLEIQNEGGLCAVIRLKI